MRHVTTIGFDADDTLWHNEAVFRITRARFAELLSEHADPSDLACRLDATQRRNMARYGFGIKGFVLSMVETAIEVTDDRVPARVIRRIIAAGHAMLEHPIEVFPNARNAVEIAARRHRTVLITKGDLLDQERKIAQSGLAELFDAIEIVSDKTEAVYASVFARHGDGAEAAVMIGDSMKSDVLPALGAGAWGIHVPPDHVWSLEHADAPTDHPRYRSVPDLAAVAALLQQGHDNI